MPPRRGRGDQAPLVLRITLWLVGAAVVGRLAEAVAVRGGEAVVSNECTAQQRAVAYAGGYDVEECASSVAQQACAAGFMRNGTQHASADAVPCPAGFWCPDRFQCAIRCVLGAMCPQASLELGSFGPVCAPYAYPPLNGSCGGASAELKCPQGHVCSTPSRVRACEAGVYCREGSFRAKPCPPLATCPARSGKPTSVAGWLFLVLVGTAVLLPRIAAWTQERWKRKLAHDARALASAHARQAPPRDPAWVAAGGGVAKNLEVVRSWLQQSEQVRRRRRRIAWTARDATALMANAFTTELVAHEVGGDRIQRGHAAQGFSYRRPLTADHTPDGGPSAVDARRLRVLRAMAPHAEAGMPMARGEAEEWRRQCLAAYCCCPGEHRGRLACCWEAGWHLYERMWGSKRAVGGSGRGRAGGASAISQTPSPLLALMPASAAASADVSSTFPPKRRATCINTVDSRREIDLHGLDGAPPSVASLSTDSSSGTAAATAASGDAADGGGADDEEEEDQDDQEQGEPREERSGEGGSVGDVVVSTIIPLAATRVAVAFRNLTVLTPSGQVCLDRVSGELLPGHTTAIMGASGAGKTTFLDALLGETQIQQGSVSVNGGEDLRDGLTSLRREIGFVPQQEIMDGESTVRETLQFYAAARLPRATTCEARERIVDAVIHALDLSHVHNERVGTDARRGLSGGERRRVNIGIGLVSAPSILLLDEPTSGLDATASLRLLQTLCNLARDGVNVAAVVHQPRFEIFCLFSRLFLLGKGGRVVYCGPTMGARPYFELLGYRVPSCSNIADVLLDAVNLQCIPIYSPAEARARAARILRVDLPAAAWTNELDLATAWTMFGVLSWSEVWHQLACPLSIADALDDDIIAPSAAGFLAGGTGGDPATGPIPPPLPSPPSIPPSAASAPPPATPLPSGPLALRETLGFWPQLGLFLTRALVQETLHPAFFVDVLLISSVGLALGLMFADSDLSQIPGMCLLVGLATGLTAIVSSLRPFGHELLIMQREEAMGLSVDAYFVAKVLSRVPFLFLAPALFLAAFYSLVNPYVTISDFYRILLSANWAVVGAGYAVSLWARIDIAQLVGVGLGMLAVMAGGIVPTLRTQVEAGYGFVMDLSFARFMIEALFRAETARWPPVWQREIAALVELYGFSSDAAYAVSRGVGVMWLMAIVWHLIAFVAVRFRTRCRRRCCCA